MPQEILRQSNFTNGELDPAMLGRRDLKAYFASCSSLTNHLVTPQGPLKRRPGTVLIDAIRRPLVAVPTDAATFTAPNGGDADAARAGEGVQTVTETDLGTDGAYVLLEIDFGVPVEVHLVDVINYSARAAEDPPPSQPAPPQQPWEEWGQQDPYSDPGFGG